MFDNFCEGDFADCMNPEDCGAREECERDYKMIAVNNIARKIKSGETFWFNNGSEHIRWDGKRWHWADGRNCCYVTDEFVVKKLFENL